jgi:hypothetical protein
VVLPDQDKKWCFILVIHEVMVWALCSLRTLHVPSIFTLRAQGRDGKYGSDKGSPGWA